MAELIYTLCALTALACAVLLLRAYGRNRVPLLFWSGICFVCFTINNVLLVLDKLVFSDLDFSMPRLWVNLLGLTVLLYGLIYDDRGPR